jgi:hypothetical protein
MIGDYHRSQPTRAAINVFGRRKIKKKKKNLFSLSFLKA